MPGGKGPPPPEDDMALPLFVLLPMPRSSTELEPPLTIPGGSGGSPPPPNRINPPEFPTGPELLRLPAGGGWACDGWCGCMCE